MPVYEFAEVEAWDEKRPAIRRGRSDEPLMNYWGYTDSYYFAAEGLLRGFQ